MVKLFVSEREIQAKAGIMLILSYFSLLASNLLVIYLANLLFPSHIVLGTFALTSTWALWLSSSKLALLGLLVMPLVAYREWKTKKDFRPQDWIMLYALVNIASLWIVTRFAEIYGLGASSWLVILGLALVMNFVQGIVMMNLSKVKIT